MLKELLFFTVIAVYIGFGIQFAQCADKGMWGDTLTASDKEKLKDIMNADNAQIEKLKNFAKEFPEAAKKLVEENNQALSNFDEYSKGIPADPHLTLEETLYLEKRKLQTEAYYLGKFLNNQ